MNGYGFPPVGPDWDTRHKDGKVNSELYATKENRDARARELRGAGHTVSRRSHRNQQMHPMYLEDEKCRVNAEDRGFGNTAYKTLYEVVYEVRWS